VTRTATDATYWEKIVEGDFAVPEDRPLDDLTVELVELLGDTAPHVRDELAWRVFTTWTTAGVGSTGVPTDRSTMPSGWAAAATA
jgi:hypothetical protein